jgi:hypothetical protein
MERHVNGYQGMNKDTAYDSIEQSQYVDARDIRISTTSGESLGAFINIKGNTLAFDIPEEGEFNNIPWTAVDPCIIGYTTIRNRIILFVADNSNTKGWVYDLQYDPANLQILTGFPALKYYNSNLLFKKEWPIEALGRYETDCVQRIYWTDYNNFFRSLNIEEPNLETLPLGQVDIFPDVEYTQPILQVVSGGGALLSGEYQVSYRLSTFDGKQTLVAPPSNMIHIVAASETLNQSAKYNGDIIQVNTGKSMVLTVDTSNYQDFDKIEFIIAYYETNIAIPVVQSIEQQSIGTSTSISFTYTGVEGSAFDIELFTFALKNHAFKTCKTLTQKDSSLVIANIKGSQVSIKNLLGSGTFNAKTRRYKFNGGSPIPPFTPGTPANDLSNAFNQTFNSDAHWLKDWQENQQYKYQSDGVTLGGEGPNISYKFHLEKFTLNGSGTDGFANVSNTPDFVYTHDFNDGYGVYPNTTYPNFASPFISGLMRGYKRGESYRFGIVFYTLKGEATYVEYIGDIKFPDISERDSTLNSSGSYYWPLLTQDPVNLDISYGYSMGIEFTIDFSTCPELLNNITGYQIVRVKRNDTDKRRLTQGFIKGFYYSPIGEPQFSDFDLRIDGNENGLHLYPYYPQSLFNNPSNPGYIAPLSNASFATLEDYEGLSNGDPIANGLGTVFYDYLVKGQYLGFYSPELSYNATDVRNLSASISNNPCLLVTGAYERTSTRLPAEDFSAEDLGDTCYDSRTTIRKSYPVTFNSIHNIKKYANTQLFSMSDTANYEEEITPLFGSYYMRNYWAMDNFTRADASNGPRLNHPNEGGNADIPEIEKAGTSLVGLVSRFSNDPLTGLPVPVNSIAGTDYFDAPYYTLDANGNRRLGPLDLNGNNDLASAPFTFPIVDLVLPKGEVYGGYTQNALEVNIFIPASPVISTSNTNPIVFGGDIFISMFTAQPMMTEFHTEFYTGTNRYRQDNTLTEAYAVETSLNLDLATGATLKTEVRYTFAGLEDTLFRQEVNNTFTLYGKTVTMYSYMPVYSRENDQINFFIEPINIKDCLVNDIRAYLSTPKVNDESIDSWTKFAANNFYDVDDYGPINKVVNWKDTVFFIQDRGFGAYAINRSAITTTNDGVATSLGTGQGFGKHEYHSKEHGSIHQWGVKTTDKGIYLFDALHKKIFVFSTSRLSADNSPLSEVKGIHSLLQTLPAGIFDTKANGGDNPILFKGVQIARDKINDEVLFTFLGSGNFTVLSTSTTYQVGDIIFFPGSGLYYIVVVEFTSADNKEEAEQDLLENSEILENPKETLKDISLIYDELIGQFSCVYSATPSIYLENGNILLSPDPTNPLTVYTHNIGNYGEFYNNINEASLTMVINPNADLNKVLRFLEYSSIVRDNDKVIERDKTITAFQVTTQYQTTGKIPFSADRIKRKFDRWRIKIPRDLNSANQKGRLRATYFELTVYFDNLENKELIMNRMMSYYDIQIF